MPSTRDPTQVVQPGPGRLPAGVVPASALAFSPEGSNAALQAHINNPTGAHASSAISYAGGPNWADGTTNPSTNVLLELNKIISDLGTGTGAAKIHYNGSPLNFANGTGLPAGTLENAVDTFVTTVGSTTATSSGARFLGVESIGTWVDSTSIAASSIYTSMASIVGSLTSQSTSHSGADRVGMAQLPSWIDGTVHLSGSIFFGLSNIISDLSTQTAFTSGASKIGISARATWLDATTNPQTDTDTAVAKIITDLSSQTTGADGGLKIGAGAAGTLTASSVGQHLFLLDDRSQKTTNQLAVNAFQNFAVPGAGLGNIATTSGNVVGSAVSAGWAVEKRMLFASNTVNVFASYDGGFTWSTEATTTMTHSDFVANGQTSALAVGSVGGAGSCRAYGSLNNAGSSNNTMTATGVPTVTRVRPDPYQTDTFWVVGVDSTGPVGSVWKVVTVNGTSPVTQTQVPASGAGSTGTLTLVAVGKTTILAGNATNLFTCSPSSPTFALSQTSPTATPIVDLFWSDHTNAFVLVASSGTNSLEFWRSATGATGTWTNFSQANLASTYGTNLTGAGTSFINVISGFPLVTSTNQSIIVLPVHLDGGAIWDLAFTYDGGISWKLLPDPLAMHQGVSPLPKVQRVSIINNRLMAYGYQAAGNIYHALSSRTGNP